MLFFGWEITCINYTIIDFIQWSLILIINHNVKVKKISKENPGKNQYFKLYGKLKQREIATVNVIYRKRESLICLRDFIKILFLWVLSTYFTPRISPPPPTSLSTTNGNFILAFFSCVITITKACIKCLMTCSILSHVRNVTALSDFFFISFDFLRK